MNLVILGATLGGLVGILGALRNWRARSVFTVALSLYVGALVLARAAAALA